MIILPPDSLLTKWHLTGWYLRGSSDGFNEGTQEQDLEGHFRLLVGKVFCFISTKRIEWLQAARGTH